MKPVIEHTLTGNHSLRGATRFLPRSETSDCPVVFSAKGFLHQALVLALKAMLTPFRVLKRPCAALIGSKTLCCGLVKPCVALENEASEKNKVIGLENEALEFSVLPDGWIKLASYRDYPLTREVKGADGVVVTQQFLQRVTKANATALANEHNSLFGKLRKLRRGAPILRGHSDRWDVASQEGIELARRKPKGLENSRFGIFAELAAREDGLYGLPVFSDDAQPAIEREGLKYFSPFWWTDVVALENGVSIVEPTELISVALTDSPNLKDSPALWNAMDENENPQSENTMKKKLVALIMKHGIALANEDDATIEGALPQLDSKLDQRVALENEKTTTGSKVVALENEIKTEKDAHKATRTALENESLAANEMAVDLAIAEGRIAISERATRLASIKDAAGRKALLNEAVKFKVSPVSTAGERRSTEILNQEGAQKAARRLVALGNELFAKGGYQNSEDAYGAAKETEEGRKLAAQLEEYKAAK